MKNKRIAITGMSGLIGSYVGDFLKTSVSDVTGFDVSSPHWPVDITDETSLAAAMESFKPDVVIHCAAFTDVTAARQQQGDKEGLAYKINVKGTEIVARRAAARDAHLIHLSTAYVFDGTNPGLYTEADQPNPIEWYGQTKLEAELAVQELAPKSTILRIDQPFRLQPFSKPDAVRKIASLIEKGVPLFDDHYFGPTIIEDFAIAVQKVIETETYGLYHASSGEKWSDYQFGELINQTLLGGQRTLLQGNLQTYLQTTNRPYQQNTALDTTKLVQAVKLAPSSVAGRLTQVNL